MFWKKKFKEIDWQLLGISDHVKELLNSVDVFDILTERRISIKSFVEKEITSVDKGLSKAIKEVIEMCIKVSKEERKFTESVRNGINKHLTKTLETQKLINGNVIELIEQLQDENETQKAQITALIESHHNRAMYNGSLKAAKKSV